MAGEKNKVVTPKRPTKIKVGAFDFSIEYLPLNEELFGDFSYINSRIRVENNLCGPVLVDTILHEINHTICRVYHVKVKEAKEEKVVSVMASAWTQIFRDNPEFSRWMQKELQQ